MCHAELTHTCNVIIIDCVGPDIGLHLLSYAINRRSDFHGGPNIAFYSNQLPASFGHAVFQIKYSTIGLLWPLCYLVTLCRRIRLPAPIQCRSTSLIDTTSCRLHCFRSVLFSIDNRIKEINSDCDEFLDLGYDKYAGVLTCQQKSDPQLPMPFKLKRQYLLSCKVSRYCLLALRQRGHDDDG